MEAEGAVRRAKAGYGAVLALGLFLSALVLSAMLLSVMLSAYRVSQEGVATSREQHEVKREGLRVLVWSYYFPASHGRFSRPYLYLVVEGGYAVRVREVLFLLAANRSQIDPYTGALVARVQLDRVVEPPCLMIRLWKPPVTRWRTLADFNRSVSHVAVVTAEGKVYYGTMRMPNATLAYPCQPDPDRNAFDLHLVVTPAAATGQVSWQVVRGTCAQQRSGNQYKLTCSAYAVIRLKATDSSQYVFDGWNIEGEKVNEREITLVLDDDYTVNARFNKV